MRNPKHTPGPWRMYEGNTGGFVFYGIAEVADMKPAYVRQESDDAATMKANAKLIAAAPELLKAARQAAMSHMQYGKVMQRDVTALLEAIAKAEGGAA